MSEDIVDKIDYKLQETVEGIFQRVMGDRSVMKKDRSIHELSMEQSRQLAELEALYRMFEKAPPDAKQLAELEAKESVCLKLAKEMNAWVAGYVQRHPPKAKVQKKVARK